MHFEAILIKLVAKRADLTEAYSEALLNEETVSQKKRSSTFEPCAIDVSPTVGGVAEIIVSSNVTILRGLQDSNLTPTLAGNPSAEFLCH